MTLTAKKQEHSDKKSAQLRCIGVAIAAKSSSTQVIEISIKSVCTGGPFITFVLSQSMLASDASSVGRGVDALKTNGASNVIISTERLTQH